MPEQTRRLMPTTPEEALDLYLRERSTEVADSTLQAHGYRLGHLVEWCDEVEGIDNTNDLNAVEGCWDQLQEWFKHRLVPDLSTPKDYIPRGITTIDEPNIRTSLTSKDSSYKDGHI